MNEGEITIVLNDTQRDRLAACSSAETGKITFIDQAVHDLSHAIAEKCAAKGIVLVRGLPLSPTNPAFHRRLFRELATGFGDLLPQTSSGRTLLDVRQSIGLDRGYATNSHLDLHTDPAYIVGLYCIRPSPSGGVNMFTPVSSVYSNIKRFHEAAFNCLTKNYALQPIYDGALETAVPILTEHFGKPMACYLPDLMKLDQLEDAQVSSIQMLGAAARRSSDLFKIRLSEGNCLFFRSFEYLHGRSGFDDYLGSKLGRHMLRVWISSRTDTSLPVQYHFLASHAYRS